MQLGWCSWAAGLLCAWRQAGPEGLQLPQGVQLETPNPNQVSVKSPQCPQPQSRLGCQVTIPGSLTGFMALITSVG